MLKLARVVCLTLAFAAVGHAASGGFPLMLSECDTSNPAQFWTPSSNNELVVTENSACLDVNMYRTDPGSQVWAFNPCHPEDKDPAHQNEAWTIDVPTQAIKEVSTGLCLDAKSIDSIVINTCSTTAASQRWIYEGSTNHIKNPGTGKCLSITNNTWSWPCAAPPSSAMPFCDQSLSLDARITNLISNLTVTEKVGLFANGAGAVPRLNIKAYQWWSEALHGVAGSPGVRFGGPLPNATSFPQVITTGASFNKTLYHAIGTAIGLEGRAFNNVGRAGLTFWTPNVNIIRDPRWGRGQETPGEDPYATSQYAANFVSGFQTGSDPRYLKASSCCKHYYAYDLENWHGVDRHHFDAIVTAQDEADTYLPAFQACVELGNASSLMCSYNSVNGVPSCANSHILTDLARKSWGFEGYITSDCGAVSDVINTHHYTNTSAATINAVLSAGMDIDCGGYLTSNLAKALADGLVDMALVDAALMNQFKVQFRLGLYDDPSKQPMKRIPTAVVDSHTHQELALNAAREGMVLLKNDNGAFPLSKDSVHTIAVVGPSGNATSTMKGNYNGNAPYLISPLEGLQAYATATYAQGCDVKCASTGGFAEAVAAAKAADATVIVIGLDQGQESEGHDRTSLALPGNQNELVSQVAAAAKGPVMVAIMTGGPVDVSAVRDNADVDGIMWVGYPGQSGGQAMAEVVFGDVNPGGRLPYTMYPAAFTNVSMFDMGMRPNATSGNPGHTYRFYNNATGEAVYPYGSGLSYTTFSTKMSVQSTLAASTVDAQLKSGVTQFKASPLSTVTVTVTNTGKLPGDDVVLLFVTPPSPGADGAPLKSLRGFDRVFLQPGESKTITFSVTAYDITYPDATGTHVVRPGEWTFHVDTAAASMTVA